LNGIHDMGGMQDMGPVPLPKEDSLFHAPWEKRMFALMVALDVPAPVVRYNIEIIPPVDYLRLSYFEKWLAALGPIVTSAGVVTPAEIRSGRPLDPSTKKWHVLSVSDVAATIAPESPADDATNPDAAFRVGQSVRARDMNPLGHTRLPRYVRGKTGTITRDCGVDVFPDTVVSGVGRKPQHFYSVRFAATDLWGDQASERDSIYLDLWEDYLEPVHARA
jgi:nitrile hydratase subunit beta